ncbi:unnamed protein product [Urochloa humidicola]
MGSISVPSHLTCCNRGITLLLLILLLHLRCYGDIGLCCITTCLVTYISIGAMDEAGGGGAVRLWSEWGIHIMVLASFTLQLFLLIFGGIRRHSSSTMLRITLWLAYLLADSTAIYALGHLSVATESRQHQLVAFWAPFRLLHLGGPDNITAYALEDNSLWLRHLQTLVVQVLGAAY